jgi:hypothetical protein
VKYSNGFALSLKLLPFLVGPTNLGHYTHPPRSTEITPLQHYYQAVRRPLLSHPYSRPRGYSHLWLLRSHRHPGSHVPYNRLSQARPTCMPDAAPSVRRLRRSLSHNLLTTDGFDIVLAIFDTRYVDPFPPSSWKSPDPNFSSRPFPSPFTTALFRAQQRKAV